MNRGVSEHRAATATFLFTDIEGSKALLTTLRERYATLAANLADFGGTEIDNQGDSFFVAFHRAQDAVSAAAEIQRALAKHEWPDGVELRVRIGLHTGEAHASDRDRPAAAVTQPAIGLQERALPECAGLSLDRRARQLRDVFDDLDELVNAVALSTCEHDKVPRSLNHRASLGRPGNRDTSSTAELEQPLVSE